MSSHSDMFGTHVPPWAEMFTDNLHNFSKKLWNLWSEIGLTEKIQHERILEAEDLMIQFYVKEELRKNKLVAKMEQKGNEVYSMSKKLGIEFNDEKLSDGNKPKPLMAVLNIFDKELEILKVYANERIATFNALQKQELELCEELDEEATCAVNDIPSMDDISNVQRIINTLEQEKFQRNKSFQSMKVSITQLLDDLEQGASTSFQSSVVDGAEGLFVLSRKNIDAMKMLHTELEQKAENNKLLEQRLKHKVATLWQRLDIPDDEQDLLLVSFSNSVPKNIARYRRELERLEEQKQANMTKLVKNLRGELEILWEKCYVSENERQLCQLNITIDDSDDILTKLEQEVDELKNRYSFAQHIYAKLDHWKKLWKKLLNLEEPQADRLFKNRGCGLLAEERERKRVKAELPRVETSLQAAVTQFEEEQTRTGRKKYVFTVMGLPLQRFLSEQWTCLEESRKEQVKERQHAKAVQLQQEMKLGTKATNTKTLRRNISHASTTTLSSHKSLVSLSSKGARGALREQNHNTPGGSYRRGPQPSFVSNGVADSTVDLTTYSKFSENIAIISEADQIRSSMMRSPFTPRNQRLACRTPPSGSGSGRRSYRCPPPATVPRNYKMNAPSSSGAFNSRQTPLPRVALLASTTTSRASPRANVTTTLRWNTNNTTATPRNLATTRQTLLRNVPSTTTLSNASNQRNVSSIARHAALYKKSPATRRNAPDSTVILSSEPRRRSSRLNTTSKTALKLTTPSRNKLHFLM